MAYPDNIDNFTDKLNKLDNNTYVIEEEVALVNGVYEGELQHDNVSLPSINVYTGSKLTGTKVENVVISTPSLTPWKNTIRIYSEVSPVYITYQTQGDTVEADDINEVQGSLVNVETELDRYKNANDSRVSAVENDKAEKTYVDTQLLTKADKNDTYTKEETDQRIQNVVGAAPEALDTLKEIADSLGDDANFAGTMTTQLVGKVDKVAGKQLSTEDYTTGEKSKLAGVQDNANDYIHPATHPGSMITEDTNHRWSTDNEKSSWNDADSKKHVHSNLSLLETITQTLIDAWNSAVTHINDSIKHITSAERSLWNTVSNKTNIGHTHKVVDITDFPSIPTKTSQLTNDSSFITQAQINNIGTGDMQKATYDKDGDGIVDNSNALQGKHSSDFAPSGFGLGTTAQSLSNGTDINTVMNTGFYKVNAGVNVPPRISGDNTAIWHYLIVISHDSAYWVSQIAIEYTTGVTFSRVLENGTWTAWKKILTTSRTIIWNDLKGV